MFLVQEYRASPGARRGHTRFNVLQEILSTEESYIASLDRCIKFWLGPVRQALKDKRAIMTEKEITTIFSSIETMYDPSSHPPITHGWTFLILNSPHAEAFTSL